MAAIPTLQMWQSTIDGYLYDFNHQIVNKKHVLVVNGNPIEFKTSFMSTLLGFDEGFSLNGKEARLIVDKNGPDVALDGVLLQSGKKYVARPAWVLVFVILCIAIPIISLGGLLNMLFGLGGMSACVAVSKTGLPTIARVLLCVLVTLVAWGCWFLLVLWIAMQY